MILFIRNTHFWNNARLEDLDLFCKTSSPLYQSRLEHLRWWDREFTIPYCKYRWFIYLLAKRNWQDMGATIIQDELSKLPEALLRASPEDWFISTDDDDWFDPQLGEHLSACSADFIHWKSLIYYTTVSIAKFDFWGGNNLCTNNFAIRVGAAQKLDFESLGLCLQHPQLFRVAKRNNWKTEESSQAWSCYNYHPGCSHIILNRLRSSHRFAKTPPPKPRIEWTHPYYLDFVEITKRVKPKLAYL